ncbi:MAG: hypothetical protein HWN66_11525 [Candidatus Helarchaeota archaeon]|nr:hypothetical protein [Candidatus Helarchaeota archaeon]
MGPENEKELKRVLCKIIEISELEHTQIQLNQKAAAILDSNNDTFSSKYGSVVIETNQNLGTDFGMKIANTLAQNLGISAGDYVEIFRFDNVLYFTPILSQQLIEYFFNIDGSNAPDVILLSSHAEFEPYTREIATRIHLRLQELSVPSLRIEIQKHFINWNQKIDATLSRYEVDITRKEEEPQIIANKLVNKNLSYRLIAKMYFRLLSQYLSSQKCAVVDIHGIATTSSRGILHPMVIIGDALSRNPLIKNFTKTIEKSSRDLIPNLWIVYRTPWGAVEYSLHLVKETDNIPIIIEARRDLRDNPETRSFLVELISNAIKKLVQNLSPK